MYAHLGLGLVWLLYYSMHSVLALNSVKKLASPLFPNYRLFYSFFSLLSLFPPLYILIKTDSKPLFGSLWGLRLGGLLIVLLGVAMSKVAFRNYDLNEFLGFAVRNTDKSSLQRGGLNAYVRHPLYSALLVILLGICLSWPSSAIFLVSGITFLYLVIGIFLEEQKLKEQFGDDYIAYSKQVKRLIPYIW